jgi:hypothetical protein
LRDRPGDQKPKANARPAPAAIVAEQILPGPVSVAPLLDTLRSHSPNGAPRYASLSKAGQPGQTIGITLVSPDSFSFGEAYTFDASGALIPGRMPKRTMGAAINGAITQSHFGWFGGWPVKAAYLLLGAALTVLCSSGVAIWLARRRDKGRPAPAWERIWSAVCWSQPVAYLVTAGVSLFPTGIPPIATWIIVTALATASAAAWTRQEISIRLRLTTAILLGAVPAIHLLLHASAFADAVGLAIDLLLAMLALAAGVSLQRSARHQARSAAAS